jgi:hypothetical protein
LDGDTLTASLKTGEGPRPMTFDPAQGVMTFEFRRVKPKD